MKAAFLLGAGVSIPAKMPSTEALTSMVLSGDGFARHTDGNYYKMPPLCGEKADSHMTKVLPYLRRLEIEASEFYKNREQRAINYEDIYFLAVQIKDNNDEFENPAVQTFIDKLWPTVRQYAIEDANDIAVESSIRGLFHEAARYIVCRVWSALGQKPSRLDHLQCIADACRDEGLLRVDLFSLNHDTLVEQCLSQCGIAAVDGFGDPINNVRYWQPARFAEKSARVRLFKLHGSINWFRFPSNVKTDHNPYGIPLESDFFHTKDPAGRLQWPDTGHPALLIGTFNKLLSYTSGIYAELYYAFFRWLPEADSLIIAGYSFGDKGINARIVDWMMASRARRIVIIDPDSDLLKKKARGAIGNRWEDWFNAGRLHVLSKGIESTSWSEIKATFSHN